MGPRRRADQETPEHLRRSQQAGDEPIIGTPWSIGVRVSGSPARYGWGVTGASRVRRCRGGRGPREARWARLTGRRDPSVRVNRWVVARADPDSHTG
jgi:hypothetical protein